MSRTKETSPGSWCVDPISQLVHMAVFGPWKSGWKPDFMVQKMFPSKLLRSSYLPGKRRRVCFLCYRTIRESNILLLKDFHCPCSEVVRMCACMCRHSGTRGCLFKHHCKQSHSMQECWNPNFNCKVFIVKVPANAMQIKFDTSL